MDIRESLFRALDEISKDLAKKAFDAETKATDKVRKDYHAADVAGDAEGKRSAIKTGIKRSKGQEMARAKLAGKARVNATEETEHLDEISKDLATRAAHGFADKADNAKLPIEKRKQASSAMQLAVKKATGHGGAKVNAVSRRVEIGNHYKEEVDLDEAETHTHRVGGYYTRRGDDKPVTLKVTASSEKEAKEKAKSQLSATHKNYRATTVTSLTAKNEEVEGLDEAISDDDWVHINHAGSVHSPSKDKIVGYSKAPKDQNKSPKLKAGANGAMRVGAAKKKGYVIEGVELDESYETYHPSYTSAINTALSHHGHLSVSDEDRDHHIASGPRKPSEGNTVSHNIPATDKAGNSHTIHIQVYNKGGNKPFELNTYSSKVPKKKMKEEVDLDEAKTDIYHQHMLKALGKTRLPKDHPYTSAVAKNGDFVVHKSGNVVGRIPAGEHSIKEESSLPPHLAKLIDPKTGNMKDPEKQKIYDDMMKRKMKEETAFEMSRMRRQGIAKAKKMAEATLSAKAGRAGEDLGAPGKNFEKIAKSAAKRYGSDEAGKRVAGAVLAKMRAHEETNPAAKDATVRSTKPNVTSNTATTTPYDVKPQRIKSAEFNKLFN